MFGRQWSPLQPLYLPRGRHVITMDSRAHGCSSVNGGWMLMLLTIALVILTCLQARGSILTRNIETVNQSRSYSLLILRTVSELAGLSLSATVSSTLERIKWALVCRKHQDSRTGFVDFLVLDAGTGVWSLLSLLMRRTSTTVRTRFYSAARLLFMVVVPLVGILIMSKLTM
jgi:hypothetical protein